MPCSAALPDRDGMLCSNAASFSAHCQCPRSLPLNVQVGTSASQSVGIVIRRSPRCLRISRKCFTPLASQWFWGNLQSDQEVVSKVMACPAALCQPPPFAHVGLRSPQLGPLCPLRCRDVGDAAHAACSAPRLLVPRGLLAPKNAARDTVQPFQDGDGVCPQRLSTLLCPLLFSVLSVEIRA